MTFHKGDLLYSNNCAVSPWLLEIRCGRDSFIFMAVRGIPPLGLRFCILLRKILATHSIAALTSVPYYKVLELKMLCDYNSKIVVNAVVIIKYT